MHAEVSKDGQIVRIRILHPRLDGSNYVIAALKAAPFVTPDVTHVDIDFEAVEYLNSLGITELVTIHRLFQEQTRGKCTFRFLGVDRKIRVILELVEVQKIAEIVPRAT
ncbi:MAG: hypothetical protein K8S54_07555 [Spirochaetia bacterium]|nr:hypothetical protein [Spirochaetia bacterium]